MFGRNTRSEIADIEFDSLVAAARPYHDASAGRAIFDGIVHEIGEYLVDGLTVGADHSGCRIFESR